MAEKKLYFSRQQSLSRLIFTTREGRSSFGFNEHKLLDRISGNIGITKLGK